MWGEKSTLYKEEEHVRTFASKRFCVVALAAAVLCPSLAFAIQPPTEPEELALTRAAIFAPAVAVPELDVAPSLAIYERGSRQAADLEQTQRFFAHHSNDWEVRLDTRGNRPNLIQGAGVPLLPGRGNRLTREELRLGHDGAIRLADVEARLRGFLDEFPELLGSRRISSGSIRAASVNVGPDKQLWFVELQQFHHGVPVDGRQRLLPDQQRQHRPARRRAGRPTSASAPVPGSTAKRPLPRP